jgi:hypothetical protein
MGPVVAWKMDSLADQVDRENNKNKIVNNDK